MMKCSFLNILKFITRAVGVLFVCMFIATSVLAEEDVNYKRTVNFEWDAIVGAKHYEVEITPAKNTVGKAQIYKSDTPVFNEKLKPGIYVMRLRSRDWRGVPGEWSAPEEFAVNIENVSVQMPKDKQIIQSTDDETESVDIKWKSISGAKFYKIQIKNKANKIFLQEDITDSDYSLKLPVADIYTISMSAHNSTGNKSDSEIFHEFTILGKKLESPEIEKPETAFVRELKWSKPKNVSAFDVKLFKTDEKNKVWNMVAEFADYKKTQIPFGAELSGGNYKLTVQAKSNLRTSSDVVSILFPVISGNRSPAAEYNALARKSIERVRGLYAIASYFITQVNFVGENAERIPQANFNALSGTGRVGMGYFIPDSPWGFLGIVDMGGIVVSGTNYTFSSIELDSSYSLGFGSRYEGRFFTGLSVKETPETVIDINTDEFVTSKIKQIAPHLGAEFWYSINPKIGFQVNYHIYLNLIGMNTPNGQRLNPSVSNQYGLLGSYKLRPNITGLLGYTKKVERISYDSLVETGDSIANTGDVNRSTIMGDYLNLHLEWAF